MLALDTPPIKDDDGGVDTLVVTRVVAGVDAGVDMDMLAGVVIEQEFGPGGGTFWHLVCT